MLFCFLQYKLNFFSRNLDIPQKTDEKGFDKSKSACYHHKKILTITAILPLPLRERQRKNNLKGDLLIE